MLHFFYRQSFSKYNKLFISNIVFSLDIKLAKIVFGDCYYRLFLEKDNTNGSLPPHEAIQ